MPQGSGVCDEGLAFASTIDRVLSNSRKQYITWIRNLMSHCKDWPNNGSDTDWVGRLSGNATLRARKTGKEDDQYSRKPKRHEAPSRHELSFPVSALLSPPSVWATASASAINQHFLGTCSSLPSWKSMSAQPHSRTCFYNLSAPGLLRSG